METDQHMKTFGAQHPFQPNDAGRADDGERTFVVRQQA